MERPPDTQLARIEKKLDAIISAAGPQRWLSVAQAAARVGYSQKSIRRAIDAGELQPYRPRSCRGVIRLDIRQLDSWVQSGTVTPRTGRGLRKRSPA